MALNIPEKCPKLVYISEAKFIKSSVKKAKQNQTKTINKKRKQKIQ